VHSCIEAAAVPFIRARSNDAYRAMLPNMRAAYRKNEEKVTISAFRFFSYVNESVKNSGTMLSAPRAISIIKVFALSR